jgi:hypothetical protein
MSISRLPHLEQTSRSNQSGSVIYGTAELRLLGGIGLDLMTAIPARHDQPHARRGSVAGPHRWAGSSPRIGLVLTNAGWAMPSRPIS